MRGLAVALAIGAMAAGMVSFAPARAGDEVIGSWKFRASKDPKANIVTYLAEAKTSQGSLTLSCMTSQPKDRQLLIFHAPSLGEGNLTYRIDAQPAVTIPIGTFGDTGLVFGDNAVAFSAKLANAKKVHLQVGQGAKSRFSADFDVTGVNTVLARLAKACDGPAKR